MEKFEIKKALENLGIKEINNGVCTGTEWPQAQGELIESFSPADGRLIAKIKQATANDYEDVVLKAQGAFKTWRKVPAPKRGEIVRQMGEALRKNKEPLASIISYEMGKIYQEGLGEVQEMIDICDFAVGQSRMLYGMTTHSEREDHRMFEQYHPLGIVGVISAFNFPVAVWAWNAMLALIAGDTVIWKPSSKTILCAIATHNIMAKVIKENNLPEGIINLTAGSSRHIGDNFLADKRVPLISATGSTNVGRRVGKIVGERLGKTILELGGNNAIIVTENADMNMAVMATLFGAIGTAGQRCTSTRRLLVTENIYDEFKKRLLNGYEQIKNRIGSPMNPETIVGPLIDKGSVNDFVNAQKKVIDEGGKIIFGGQVLNGDGFESGCYVMPALAEVENSYQIVQDETFAPLLYLIKCKNLDDAMDKHNDVPQGLSSAMFSNHVLETERFLSCTGSDCGIANVNIGTSGAEIGGAFGGEKETGGGRESGSDAWKVYMRRQTNTINYSADLHLAQGLKFDI
jgi:aldehyde dehydrogenase (NAD+)